MLKTVRQRVEQIGALGVGRQAFAYEVGLSGVKLLDKCVKQVARQVGVGHGRFGGLVDILLSGGSVVFAAVVRFGFRLRSLCLTGMRGRCRCGGRFGYGCSRDRARLRCICRERGVIFLLILVVVASEPKDVQNSFPE